MSKEQKPQKQDAEDMELGLAAFIAAGVCHAFPGAKPAQIAKQAFDILRELRREQTHRAADDH